MTIDELSVQLKKLQEEFNRLVDEQVKTRRSNEDSLANLDYENMPQVAKIIRSTESGLATINTQVNGDGAEIVGLVEFVDPETGVTASAATSIVASINGSSATISADNINLIGTTTFIASTDDLGAYATLDGLSAGTTEIDGACIRTGKIYAYDQYGDSLGYTLMDSDGFSIYTSDGELDYLKLKLGYIDGEVDYPFVEVGAGDGNPGTSGLIKKMYDCLWVGNSAPIACESVADLTSVTNAAGIYFTFGSGASTNIYGDAYYGGYEIATLNDIPDISGLESDIQWLNYQITDPGAILDRLDDLESRVYNLENP